MKIEDLKGHTLVLGTTGYGKSVLSRWICSTIRPCMFTAVLDIEGEKWDCDICETSFRKFKKKIEYFMKVKRTRELFEKHRRPFFYLFIEEAHEYKGREAEQLRSWAKRIRKYGGKIFFIGQRCVDVEKSIRTECESYIVFNQSVADNLELKATTNSTDIAEYAPNLKEGEFFVRYARHTDIDMFEYVFDKRTKAGVRVEPRGTVKMDKTRQYPDTV